MTYQIKELQLNLHEDDVYYLWDLIMFALDKDAEDHCLTEDKRAFAKKLCNILDETK